MKDFEDITTCGEEQIFLEECEECDDCTSRGLEQITIALKDIKQSIINNYNYLKKRIEDVEGTVLHFQNNFKEIWAYISRLKPPVCAGGEMYNWSSTEVNTGEVLMKTSNFDYEFAFQKLPCPFPIGSVFMNINNIDPKNYWQGTEWERIAQGRTLVGVNESNALFDAPQKTGGDYDAHTISHNHGGNTGDESEHKHHIASGGSQSGGGFVGANAGVENNSGFSYVNSVSGEGVSAGYGSIPGYLYSSADTYKGDPNTYKGEAHHHGISTDGISGKNKNIQPYITTYMWKRIS